MMNDFSFGPQEGRLITSASNSAETRTYTQRCTAFPDCNTEAYDDLTRNYCTCVDKRNTYCTKVGYKCFLWIAVSTVKYLVGKIMLPNQSSDWFNLIGGLYVFQFRSYSEHTHIHTF